MAGQPTLAPLGVTIATASRNAEKRQRSRLAVAATGASILLALLVAVAAYGANGDRSAAGVRAESSAAVSRREVRLSGRAVDELQASALAEQRRVRLLASPAHTRNAALARLEERSRHRVVGGSAGGARGQSLQWDVSGKLCVISMRTAVDPSAHWWVVAHLSFPCLELAGRWLGRRRRR